MVHCMTPRSPTRRHLLMALVAGLAPLRLTAGEKASAGSAPSLMLANVYRPGLDLGAYWISEKFDGVRGYWDGRQLLTRGGESIHAPAWFTAGWPAEPMDGELWAGRGQFEQAVSTVRSQKTDDTAWRSIRFMVFDLPAHAGTFTQRITAYAMHVEALGQTWVQAVKQERVESHAALVAQLHGMVRAGAEGLMLHRGDSLYRGVRSDDLIKLKIHEDADGRVLGHLPGQGRHAGRMGALLVETAGGVQFRLGSGFTDAQRNLPPALGTWVTYRYRGVNESGVPRFASFLRVRSDLGPAR